KSASRCVPTGGSVQAAAPSSNPTSTAAKMEEGVVEEVAFISVLCRDQPDHGANEAASHRVGYGSEYNRHSVALLSSGGHRHRAERKDRIRLHAQQLAGIHPVLLRVAGSPTFLDL